MLTQLNERPQHNWRKQFVTQVSQIKAALFNPTQTASIDNNQDGLEIQLKK